MSSANTGHSIGGTKAFTRSYSGAVRAMVSVRAIWTSPLMLVLSISSAYTSDEHKGVKGSILVGPVGISENATPDR